MALNVLNIRLLKCSVQERLSDQKQPSLAANTERVIIVVQEVIRVHLTNANTGKTR